MARTTLLPSQVASGSLGIAPALVAADNVNGMLYPAKAARLLWVKNANAGSLTVTIRDPYAPASGLATPDRTIVLATATERLIGPVESIFTQTDGNVYVDFSIGASVTVGLVDVAG